MTPAAVVMYISGNLPGNRPTQDEVSNMKFEIRSKSRFLSVELKSGLRKASLSTNDIYFGSLKFQSRGVMPFAGIS